MTAKPMMILVAGPYRSGTNDDPVLIKKNVEEMEFYALPIFRAGHMAGSTTIGDAGFNEVFHPAAIRLLEKCDGVLRVGGPSTGADEMVRIGRSLGLSIYSALAEVPKLQ
jgi:hypothetical protein